MLTAKAIKTRIHNKETKLIDFLTNELVGENLEGKILAITSKIVSLSEKRLIFKKSVDKNELIKKEADIYLGETQYDIHLTIKDGLIIPSAGIDESNIKEDAYLLYPKDPFTSAKRIYIQLKEKLILNNFGIILTDSTTTPLKRGVTGTCLSYYGFEALENKVGDTDLFGNQLKHTYINKAEAIAATATLTMGEGNDCKPLCIVNTNVVFREFDCKDEQYIPITEDIYSPLFKRLL